MLDTDTKRRIDTARDILVGKVPDPKSQVEQITIAMIYKFMDDMDAESEEFGGNRTFFAGKFADYGWAKLMHSGLGGQETLNLYAEAITKMPENPGIPALFRDIFKNAYLPYRDPETLRMFLKVIDEFSYEHSENLGDAFEYLLSVLGSQGDAGQFRTPRHIIDFMVEIVDPKKNETVLDPACGTAGFLISSYKHILKANSDADGNPTLSPDERGRLAQNFKGYDISPDMVRLSLVNLYLHGFAAPNIHEYDTLTSLEKWNQYADVILANPPFMSPKGGIQPHKRFSVQSKRSEVLFVDYMAEHLTPNGRAAIIVPEGIIFQSGKAYVQLRRLLVEEYLVAVISLPAGVFNPYSGVKTSILILDKALAKKSQTIAFFKVENDGFSLGAQRRENGKNDLPQALAEIADYLRRLRNGEALEEFQPGLGLIVKKERIAENGEYDLSGDRYRGGVSYDSRWPSVQVKEVFRKSEETIIPALFQSSKTYIGLENITQNSGEITGNCFTENLSEIKSIKNVFKPGDILYGKLRPKLNKVWVADQEGICSTDIFVLRSINEKTIPTLYGFIFRSTRFNKAVLTLINGAQLPRIGWPSFEELQIPLPPLEIQKEIVAEIEGYQKVIDGARAVVENYRPHITVQPDWPLVRLGDVCAFKRGPFGGSLKKEIFVNSGYAVYEQSHAITNDFSKYRYFIDSKKFDEMAGFRVCPGDVIMSCSGTMGKVAIIPENAPEGVINQALLRLTPMKQVLNVFLKLWMESKNFQQSLTEFTYGAAIKNVASVEVLKGLKLPLPSLASQQAIVAEIEAEQALVASNRELIARFEKKIQGVLARVWGESEAGK